MPFPLVFAWLPPAHPPWRPDSDAPQLIPCFLPTRCPLVHEELVGFLRPSVPGTWSSAEGTGPDNTNDQGLNEASLAPLGRVTWGVQGSAGTGAPCVLFQSFSGASQSLTHSSSMSPLGHSHPEKGRGGPRIPIFVSSPAPLQPSDWCHWGCGLGHPSS